MGLVELAVDSIQNGLAKEDINLVKLGDESLSKASKLIDEANVKMQKIE